MKVFLSLLLAAFLSVSHTHAEPDQVAIQLYTPTGWVLEVRPNGSGTLTLQKEPYPSATARPYTFNYLMLLEELQDRPTGDSVYRYAFVTDQKHTQKPKQIIAPRDSEFVLILLLQAARILYSENTEGFYRARITHPVFSKAKQP